jgi:hypothetical protein
LAEGSFPALEFGKFVLNRAPKMLARRLSDLIISDHLPLPIEDEVYGNTGTSAIAMRTVGAKMAEVRRAAASC